MPAFSQPLSLPLDIVETILSEFAVENDLATLKSCSQVSQVLHSLCRKHIFSKVELDSAVQRSGTSQVQRFKRLLDIDFSIANHVRSLDYTNVCNSKPAPPVLKHFRRVTSFTLRFFGGTQEWKTMPLPFKKSLATFMQYNKLANLDLFCIQGVPAAIFTCLPHLESLMLYCVTLVDAPLQSKFFKAKRVPKLVSLFMKNSEVGPLIRLPPPGSPGQAPVLDLTRLEKFSFGIDEDSKAMEVIKPILKTTESLRYLALSGSHPDINLLGALSGDLNSKSLEKLKTIDLRPMLETQEQDPYLNLAAELERIAGKNAVEEITLRISIETDRRCTTDPSRWNQLDRVLSLNGPGAFPSLRSVEVKVIVHHWYREVAEFQFLLEEIGISGFPSLRNDHNLRFSFEVIIEDD